VNFSNGGTLAIAPGGWTFFTTSAALAAVDKASNTAAIAIVRIF
jgi:hypothetical protein